MSKCYRVIFQTYEDSEPGDIIKEEVILDSKITLPTNCLDFTVGIKTQLAMVGQVQSNVLNEKLALLADMQDWVLTTFLRKCNISKIAIPNKACRA